MRVLHLLKTGDGARWAYRQIEVLAAAGVEIHVALPEGAMSERYRASGVTTHHCQPGLRPTDPRTWREAVATVDRLVEEIAPDLVHSHFVDTTLAMRRALRDVRMPRVFQVPGPLHLEHAATRAVEIRSADDQDHWIATCAWVRQSYLRSGLPGSRVHLSYYGTDVEEFRAAAGEPSLRAELGVDPATPLVGMVAYFYAPKRYLGQRTGLKGHEDLIDAAARLVAGGRPLHVVFVGGPWQGAEGYAARVRRLAAARLPGQHTFLGLRDDVPRIYADLDLAVHPSSSENLGGAAESLLSGTPTVATRVGGFPDLVVEGRTGWLATPRDPDSLADAIGRALDEPQRAAVAAAGRRRAERLLDVSVTAAGVHQIYRQLLATHP